MPHGLKRLGGARDAPRSTNRDAQGASRQRRSTTPCGDREGPSHENARAVIPRRCYFSERLTREGRSHVRRSVLGVCLFLTLYLHSWEGAPNFLKTAHLKRCFSSHVSTPCRSHGAARYAAFVEDGFNSEVADQFEVVGIPKPILVGPDGQIVATEGDLRGEDLLETVEEHLGSTTDGTGTEAETRQSN